MQFHNNKERIYRKFRYILFHCYIILSLLSNPFWIPHRLRNDLRFFPRPSIFSSPIHKSDVDSVCSIRHTAGMRYPDARITARPIRPYPSNNPFWIPHRLRNDLRFFPRPSIFSSPIHKSDVDSVCSIRHTAGMRYPDARITARPIRPYPSNNPFWIPHRLRNDLRFFPRPSIFFLAHS